MKEKICIPGSCNCPACSSKTENKMKKGCACKVCVCKPKLNKAK